MAGICGPHHLESRRSGSLGFVHDAVRLPTLGTVLGQIRYGSDVTIGIDRDVQLDGYSLSLPLEGSQILRSRGEKHRSDAGGGVVVSPFADQELDISADCRKLQVVIRRPAAQEVLEKLLERPAAEPLAFDPRMDMRRGEVAAWWRMAAHLFDDWHATKQLYRQPGIAPGLEFLLIKGLLLAQPNNYSRELADGQDPDCPEYVRRACRFIRDNARRDLRLEDIEAIARVSRQRLYESLRSWTGFTPMAYLKRCRLEGARAALLAALPGASVSTVALDWGFNHFGRFAREYRTRYGEAPSETLCKRGTPRPCPVSRDDGAASPTAIRRTGACTPGRSARDG
ncbi:AraC family transcriptional regulator [Thauera sinica]|uniref:Helix-turn-helix domain-containing protein n=2 Tax=Thauera TaxID=33057 RepID=A0ABW1AR90_9RHOO